jgi:hypothetical protein
MSVVLDKIQALAADDANRTVTLTPLSVAVLFYASGLLEQKKQWLDTDEYQLDEITDADWDAIEKICGNLIYEVMTEVTPVAQIFPIRADLNACLMLWNIAAGTVAPAAAAVPYGSYAQQSTPTNLDSFKADFSLAAGAYVLEMWYLRSGDNAKIDIFIDSGEEVSQLDLYGTSLVTKVAFNVDILADGNHTIQVVSNGKNASSSNYRMRIASLSLWKY